MRQKRETRDEEREWVESEGGPAPCDNPSKWVCLREGRATRLPSSSHDTCPDDVVDHSSFSQSRARGAPWDPPHFSNECVSKSHHVASSKPFFFFVKQNKQDKEYVNLHVPLLPTFPSSAFDPSIQLLTFPPLLYLSVHYIANAPSTSPTILI